MNKKSFSFRDVRVAATALLALAVKQRFPEALCKGGRATPLGFYCDFLLPGSFNTESLKQVEEVMQSWIRQNLEVQVQEMVGVSAKEYFLFHKEPFLAEFIERSESSSFFLLKLAGLGMLLEEDTPVRYLREIGFCHLQKSERVAERLRIYGTAFLDKYELKKFLKQEGRREIASHQALGMKNKLFFEQEGQWFWLPAGQKIRRNLKRRIEEEEEVYGFLKVSTISSGEEFSAKSLLLAHQKLLSVLNMSGTQRFSESVTSCLLSGNDQVSGLFQSETFEGIYSHVFCSKKDLLPELISSLHFMTKIFKILGFAFHPIFFESRRVRDKEMSTLLIQALKSEGWEPEIRAASLGKSRIEWHVQDSVGQSWIMASIHCPIQLDQSDLVSFAISPCLSIERVIALLLEKEQGKFPDWLER